MVERKAYLQLSRHCLLLRKKKYFVNDSKYMWQIELLVLVAHQICAAFVLESATLQILRAVMS